MLTKTKKMAAEHVQRPSGLSFACIVADQEVFDGVEVGASGGAANAGVDPDHADAEPVVARGSQALRGTVSIGTKSRTPYK